MSSRGAKTQNGHVTTTEYQLKGSKMINDAKVLVGSTKQQHGLPDFAHSPDSKYIKENPDGSFCEMRVYDSKGFPVIEIAFHPEESLTGNRHDYVLHYHLFGSDLKRTPAKKLSESDHSDIYSLYSVYLKEYGL